MNKNETELAMKSVHGMSMELAHWVENTNGPEIPEAVVMKARLHVLDTLGLGLASRSESFAEPAQKGIVAAAGAGICSVLGDSIQLAARDAAMVNGLLMHGLDFDDTHPFSIIHASVASLPTALAMGEHVDASWAHTLCAYIIGVEVATRIGASVKGGFHHVGFHATGVVSHFSAALVAGKLLALNQNALTAAQGIAASTASGVQVFLEEGAWTKRMHPGWGAMAGITAAYMANAGFVAPSRPYEGKFGLYDTHLHDTQAAPELLTAELGTTWNLLDTAIKPYPVCHFNHGCIEAAIVLHRKLQDRIDDVIEIKAWLAEPTFHIVAEPIEAKQNVTTDYEAKFSVQYCVAVGLLKGQFGLKELQQATIQDSAIRRFTQLVQCFKDLDTRFPNSYSGGVTVKLRDGTELHEHIAINKGAGSRMLTAEDVIEKFRLNVGLVASAAQIDSMIDVILHGRNASTREVMQKFRL